MNEISDRLIQIRTKLGLNRKEFSEIVGMPHSSYSHLERGRKPNNLKRLLPIVEEFNINKDWLLYGKGEMSKSNIAKDDSIQNDSIKEKMFTIEESDIPLLFQLFQFFNYVREFDKKTQEKILTKFKTVLELEKLIEEKEKLLQQ